MNANSADTDPGISDYLLAFRRRLPRMVMIAAVVIVAALVLAFGIPPVYTSRSTILFESPDVPTNIVQTTITAEREEYINNISKRVVREENLRPLVEKFGLFGADGLSIEERIDKTRDAIAVDSVLEESAAKRRASLSDLTIGFTVSFSYFDPVIAQQATRDLANMHIQENVATRTEAAAATAQFLSKDSDKLAQEIAAAEQALTSFKSENAQFLPEVKAAMQNQLDRSEGDAAQLQQSYQALEEREIFLKAQLAQVPARVVAAQGTQNVDPRARLDDLQAEYVRLSSMYSPEHPDIIRLKRAIAQASSQAGVTSPVIEIADNLVAREAELRTLQQQYASDHPDLVRLQKTIGDLRARLNSVTAQQVTLSRPNNPAYIQLQAQLDAASTERRSMLAQIGDRRARAEEARRRLLRVPEVERQLLTLTRDYDFAVQRYRESMGRLGKAELAESLESEVKGERLAIRSGANLPGGPSTPNRPLILFLGLVLAVSLGGGAGILAEFMDQTVRGSKDLYSNLGMLPIATIPYIETGGDERKRRRRTAMLASAGAACIVVVAVLFVFNG